MPSKQVPDVPLFTVLTGAEEFHLVVGVVRDGSGNVTNHGNSRRTTLNVVVTWLDTRYLKSANNLSDLASPSSARTNLGLGSAATFAATAFLQTANSLSDLGSPSSARHNLGLLRLIPFFFTTTPSSSEILAIYGCADVFTIPANLAGSSVKPIPTIGVNPAASFALDVRLNDVSFGTITIHTDGTVTIASTAKTTAIGDVVTVHAPGTADASIANWAINLMGVL